MNPRRSQRVNIHGADPADERPVVLLVDDDPVVRDILAWVIQSTGHTPLMASGEEGFRMLAERPERVALVLLDLTMHDMDGFRFREQQLAQPRLAAVPTVIMSGRYVEDDERVRLRALQYVWKPFRISELREVIAEHARWQPVAAAASTGAASVRTA